MAIKNKITVGLKQILEVDANPMLSATPAPIGSHAMWQDGTVGKAYLKTGAGDTDWMAYQVGNEPADWKFVYDKTQLNEANAISYFGTNALSQDEDVRFVRQGQDIFAMTSSGIQFLQGSSTILASSLNISASSIISISASDRIERQALRMIDKLQAPDDTPAISVGKSAVKGIAPTGTGTATLVMASGFPNKARVVTLKAMINDANGFVAHFIKTVSLSASNLIVETQDDYTAKGAGFNNVRMNTTYNSGTHQFSFEFLNLALPVDSKIVVSSEEESHQYDY